MKNNEEIIIQLSKQIAESIKPQLEISTGLKTLQETARMTVSHINEVNQNIIRPSQIINEAINKSVMANLRTVTEAISEKIREININVEPIRQMATTIRPLIEYAEENKDKIQNFQDSTEIVVNQLMDIHNIGEDEAFDLIDVLIEEGKIITHEDWSIELTLEQDVSDIKRSSLPLSDIINLIGIFLNLILILNGGDSLIDIDNSVTNIENQTNGDVHYHTTDTSYISNEYIVVNDTKLYEDYNIESDVITKLNSGDKINRIINEDNSDFMLVAIINEDTEIEHTGWIKIEDITLID